nr:angelicin synthase-like [Ipomoea batatas]
MEILALFTFSVLLILSPLWLYTKSISKKAAPLPLGPRGFPVVGYLPFLRPNLHHHFTDLARKYGPIFKLQLGSRLVVTELSQLKDSNTVGPSLPNIPVSTIMPYAEIETCIPEITSSPDDPQSLESSPEIPENTHQDSVNNDKGQTANNETATINSDHDNDEIEVVNSSPPHPRRSNRDRRAPNKFQDYYCDTTIKKVTSPHSLANVISYGHLDMQHAIFSMALFVREMLSSANLRACYEHRREEVRKAIRSVRSRIGEPVNIGELASSTEINVVARMIWGSTLGSDEAKIDEIGAEFREIVGKFMAMARMENMVKVLDNIFDPIIKEGVRIVCEKSGSTTKDDEKKDFLQILLELKNRDDNAGKSLDFQAIKAMLLDIVIGGTDTTATMVEWIMTALLDNPEIMKKVQKELDEIVGMTSIVEEVHLPKLKYLDAVVKETFRLYPALPLLVPKCPSQTTEVGGYTIPKDTKVFLNMYAIHRDPKLWDNPLQFSPERFLNQTSGLDYTDNDHRFLPFGSGRRICAGIPLAEKMLIYILGSLLHSFDWHLPEGEKMDLSDGFGLVIKKNTPLVAVPALRILGQIRQHGMNMDDSIAIASIIDKLPPSWKKVHRSLMQRKEEITMEQLGAHLLMTHGGLTLRQPDMSAKI